MDSLDDFMDLTPKELHKFLLGELAKSSSELRNARQVVTQDLNKIQGRLKFTLAAVNELIERDDATGNQ